LNLGQERGSTIPNDEKKKRGGDTPTRKGFREAESSVSPALRRRGEEDSEAEESTLGLPKRPEVAGERTKRVVGGYACSKKRWFLTSKTGKTNPKHRQKSRHFLQQGKDGGKDTEKRRQAEGGKGVGREEVWRRRGFGPREKSNAVPKEKP